MSTCGGSGSGSGSGGNSRRVELMTVQSGAIKTVVDALRDNISETHIEFDEKGMKIMTTDAERMVLVHLVLDAAKFESYRCEQKMSIGVNIHELCKLTKVITNNDALTMYVDSDDLNHLGLVIENYEKKWTTQSKLRLIDLGEERIVANPMMFDTVITLPSADFHKVCRDMHNLGDVKNVEIKDVKNQLIFSCRSGFAEHSITISDKNDSMYSNEKKNMNEIVQGEFSLKHLMSFTKCTSLSSTVEIMLKNNFPLVVRYGVASLGEIKLCLAPQEEQ